MKNIFLCLLAINLGSALTSCSVSGGPSLTSSSSVSTDSSLKDLNLSVGTLVPPFTKEIKTYSASVPYAATTFKLIPSANDGNVTITVVNSNVRSGNSSSETTLNVGMNAIPVVVRAGNGSTTVYTINVTRAQPSLDSTLSQLTFSSGTLSPTFDPATTSYQISISDVATSFRVTPTATDTHATITTQLNSTARQTQASGVASAPMTPTTGANTVTITVTAEDGSVRNYSVALVYGLCSAGAYSDGVNGCSPVGRGNYSTGNDVLHACTNAPVNSHYTSTRASSTNCPWSCNDGYLTTDGVSCSSYPNALNLTCDDTEVAVGLYGRSGSILDRLGVRCAILKDDGSVGTIRNGPTYGGNGGGPFNYDGTTDCPAGSVLYTVDGYLTYYSGANRTGQIRWRCIDTHTQVVSDWLPSPYTYFGNENTRSGFHFQCGTAPNNYGSYINGIIIDNASGAAYTGDTLGANCR